MNAAEILGSGGPIARWAKNYECRVGQQNMARHVERALLRDETLLIEAGTGTGKTWAYLVPALLSGRKIVISTATKALQDQISEHDLPELQRYLGVQVDAVSIKGLNNYLCLRRMEEFSSSAEAIQPEFAAELTTIRAWLGHTSDGERSKLLLAEDSRVWPRVMSSSETRVGPRCEHYDRCFVTNIRRRVNEAQIVITNHHFFCADLALRSTHPAALLADYEAVIFDEAHELPEIATAFFGRTLSQRGVERLVRDTKELAQTLTQADREVVRLADAVLRSSAQVFSVLPTPLESTRQVVDDDFVHTALFDDAVYADAALEALQKHLELCDQKDETALVQSVTRRIGEQRDVIAHLLEQNKNNSVTWMDRSAHNIAITCSPIEVSNVLNQHLFSRVSAVVFTSATLATDGSFDFIRARLGLEDQGSEEVVTSSFNFKEQCALYLPELAAEPRDSAYLVQAVAEIERLVRLTAGGALVLFTSLRMMRAAHAQLASRWTFPTWIQGEAPHHILLERLRQSENGVLFATSSFWQGVDVAGPSLRLVIIDKLPFDVPTDPLIAARCKKIEAEDESAFMKYLVPSAIMELKQGFGRLIRTERDRGIVALLDARVSRRHYGKKFLRSLPDATRCRGWEEVQAFWQLVPEQAAVEQISTLALQK